MSLAITQGILLTDFKPSSFSILYTLQPSKTELEPFVLHEGQSTRFCFFASFRTTSYSRHLLHSFVYIPMPNSHIGLLQYKIQLMQNDLPSVARFEKLCSRQSQYIFSFLAPPLRSVSVGTLRSHRRHSWCSASIFRRHQQWLPFDGYKVDTFSAV